MPNYDHANRLFGEELTQLMDYNMDFLRKRFEGWSKQYNKGEFHVEYVDVQRAYATDHLASYLNGKSNDVGVGTEGNPSFDWAGGQHYTDQWYRTENGREDIGNSMADEDSDGGNKTHACCG
jgi:hypothetical protein